VDAQIKTRKENSVVRRPGGEVSNLRPPAEAGVGGPPWLRGGGTKVDLQETGKGEEDDNLRGDREPQGRGGSGGDRKFPGT